MSFKSVFFLSLVLFFVANAQISHAVAVNMKFTFNEITDSSTIHSGFKIPPVYGSSEKLITQIKNVAPYGLFIFADSVFTKSIIVFRLNCNKPRIYAFGKIVLWILNNFDLPKEITIHEIDSTLYNPLFHAIFIQKNGKDNPVSKNYTIICLVQQHKTSLNIMGMD